MPHRLLPVELWHQIAHSLLRDDLRPLLCVSRTLHSVALRILFNRVELYIASPSTGPKRRVREEVARGFLERVGRDAQLAHAVVRLTIYAGDGGLQGKAGWQRLLVRALGNLKHLRSFEWICTPDSYIPLSKRIVTELIACCPDLDTFAYICGAQDDSASYGFDRLRGLRMLTLSSPRIDNSLDDVIKANSTSLRSLTFSAPFVSSDIFDESLGGLEHIGIYQGLRPPLLHGIFAHCAHLESLTLYASSPADYSAAAFETAPTMPHLSTLRLVGVGPALAAPLARFLHVLPRLRRLYVADRAPSLHTPDWSPLLDALVRKDASPLTALGMDLLPPVEGDSFTDALPALPKTLRALAVRGTNALRFIDADAALHNIEALHMATYAADAGSVEDAGTAAACAFDAHAALNFIACDAWAGGPFARPCSALSSAAEDDYTWLTAMME